MQLANQPIAQCINQCDMLRTIRTNNNNNNNNNNKTKKERGKKKKEEKKDMVLQVCVAVFQSLGAV